MVVVVVLVIVVAAVALAVLVILSSSSFLSCSCLVRNLGWAFLPLHPAHEGWSQRAVSLDEVSQFERLVKWPGLDLLKQCPTVFTILSLCCTCVWRP